MPRPCPLLCSIPRVRAFKWGTVWHSTSRGIKTTRSLSLKIPKSLLLLSKVESLNLKVVAVLMPLEIKRHTVPHLKALTRSIEHWGRHGHSSTFKLHYNVLKSTILLHKSAKRRFHVTVAVYNKKKFSHFHNWIMMKVQICNKRQTKHFTFKNQYWFAVQNPLEDILNSCSLMW